ncbi:UvrD-helicase domain-containing protein [Candidatus Babeliales bacterium]|nr:UvrD-helicase domain-containing protein [Candidatus Babeliales bacterium]
MDYKKQFNHFISKELNKPQQEAATQKSGALLVIAGAGSGKTRVITARIANLIINENVSPKAITALTFTNKAAEEMKERLHKFLDGNHQLPFVGTFHSYCLLLLRTNLHYLPAPYFSILDGDDQLSIVKQIIKKGALEKQITPSQIMYQLSQYKNKYFMNPQEAENTVSPLIKEIYHAYEAEKTAAHSFDFDDLILQVLKLFRTNKTFKRDFQAKIKHVLVDEYQDTSHTQHELLRQMGLDDDKKFILDSLCAVGDEDQSIYSWRGATVTNMLKIKQEFAPVTTVKIEQNYRSVTPILETANHVIQHNTQRNPKKLWSEKQGKNRILLLTCRSGEQEADAVAILLKNLPENKKLSNVALLYRTHYQSRSLEESLIYHAIPYRIIGGIRFYERKEIKDVLAYLRLMVNPFDRISLLRIVNYPLRGLGQKFEEQLMEAWQQNPLLDFQQLITHLISSEGVSSAKQLALKQFLAIYTTAPKNGSPSDLIDHVLTKIDYLNYLRTTLDAQEADTKIENVRELVQSIATFEKNFSGSHESLNPNDPFASNSNAPTLENFLYEVTLMQEKSDNENRDDQVCLMTLHGSKGLEFDMVIITGLEEEMLPSGKALNTNEELEEERRLFYVGITRAEERLVLTHADYRNRFGTIVHQIPSRFLSELKRPLVQEFNASNAHATQLKTQFRRWLGLSTQFDQNILTFTNFIPPDRLSTKNQTATTTAHENRRTSMRKTAAVHKAPASYKSAYNSVRPEEPRASGRLEGSAHKAAPTSEWYKNQLVEHSKFGKGIVTHVEKADGDAYHITAIFQSGPKKILSSFLKKG